MHVAPHAPAITKISNGDRAWVKEPHRILKEFRDHYLNTHCALPSNTQNAESTIKDANYCTIMGRSEGLASTYSTARSGLVDKINQSTKGVIMQSVLRGNQHVCRGIYGERNKPDGSLYEEKSKKRRAAGGIRTEAAIELVYKRHKNINTYLDDPIHKKEWECLQSAIADKAHSFVMKCVEAKVEAYKKSQQKQKAPNVLQRHTGIQETDMTSGTF